MSALHISEVARGQGEEDDSDDSDDSDDDDDDVEGDDVDVPCSSRLPL